MRKIVLLGVAGALLAACHPTLESHVDGRRFLLQEIETKTGFQGSRVVDMKASTGGLVATEQTPDLDAAALEAARPEAERACHGAAAPDQPSPPAQPVLGRSDPLPLPMKAGAPRSTRTARFQN
jgi:hypothetical protein